jgi:GT2 family glycosyltransferase
MRCPFPQILLIAPLRVLRQFMYAVTQGWSWWRREPRWWLDAVGGVGKCLENRRPIRWREYWAWVRLARRPAFAISDLEYRFRKRFLRPAMPSLNVNSPVSVMITTRDRSADLAQTLNVLANMKHRPDEILVTADGCQDDTIELIRRDYPECQLIVNDVHMGSVTSRDRMIRLARNELIVSLDDDSYPTNPSFFGEVSKVFIEHPAAAVVTFSELRDGGVYSTGMRTPVTKGHYVSAYPNCAAAMRRSVYLQQAGFPRFFQHMYEETDYALQCYADGFSVWFEPSQTVRHHVSAKNRGWMRRHHLNARNELWSVWMRCPWPWLPVVSVYRIWRQFRYACTEGASWGLQEPRWWLAAIKGWPQCWKKRAAIPWSVYYGWMRLARHPRFEPGAYRTAKQSHTRETPSASTPN